MATQENENYIRIILLLMEGGMFILKALLNREIEKSQHNIDQHLLLHQRHLKHNVKAKKQYKKLFPSAGATSIVTWDIDLLAIVIVQLFKPSISIDEWINVQLLRRFRQDVQAHASTASISNVEYSDIKGHLEKALNAMSNGLGTSQQQKILKIISMATTDPLDIRQAIENLQSLSTIDDTLQDVNNKLENIFEQMLKEKENIASKFNELEFTLCRSIGTSQSEIHEGIDAAKHEILTPLQDTLDTVKHIEAILKEKKDKSKVVYEIKKKLTFSSEDENKAQEAEEMVYKLTKKAANTVEDSVTNVACEGMKSEHPNIEATVRKIVSEIQNENDTVIIKVKRKCIVLTIQCISYAGLLHLFNYSSSEQFNQDLDALSVFLTECFETKIVIQATIVAESFQIIVQESGNTESESDGKHLVMSVQCQSMEGVKRIVDLYTNGCETNSLNQLSIDLSEYLQQQISISSSWDRIHIMTSSSVDEKSMGTGDIDMTLKSEAQERKADVQDITQSDIMDTKKNTLHRADTNYIGTQWSACGPRSSNALNTPAIFVESNNYYRLLLLVVDKCSEKLLQLFYHFIPKEQVRQYFESKAEYIQFWKQGGLLSDSQYNMLNVLDPNPDEYDIFLLMKLLKYFNIAPDRMIDIENLKNICDEILGHKAGPTLTEHEFETLWARLQVILIHISQSISLDEKGATEVYIKGIPKVDLDLSNREMRIIKTFQAWFQTYTFDFVENISSVLTKEETLESQKVQASKSLGKGVHSTKTYRAHKRRDASPECSSARKKLKLEHDTVRSQSSQRKPKSLGELDLQTVVMGSCEDRSYIKMAVVSSRTAGGQLITKAEVPVVQLKKEIESPPVSQETRKWDRVEDADDDDDINIVAILSKRVKTEQVTDFQSSVSVNDREPGTRRITTDVFEDWDNDEDSDYYSSATSIFFDSSNGQKTTTSFKSTNQQSSKIPKTRSSGNTEREMRRDSKPNLLTSWKVVPAPIELNSQSLASSIKVLGQMMPKKEIIDTEYEQFKKPIQDQVQRNKDYQVEDDLPSGCMQVEFVSLLARHPCRNEKDAGNCKQGFNKWRGKIVRNFKNFKKLYSSDKLGLPHIIGGSSLEVHVAKRSMDLEDLLKESLQNESQKLAEDKIVQDLFDHDQFMEGRQRGS